MPTAPVLRVRSQHWGAETAVDISNRLTRAALMLVAVVWPADRDAQPATKAGDPLDMVERLGAVHAEPIDHIELIKVVPLRDDLISAVRYAFMMRRNGKPLDGCEPYGRAPGVEVVDIYDPRRRAYQRREPQIAEGTDFDVFTGR